MLYNNILETVGDTPLIKLNKITKGLRPAIYAKCEFLNPGGSVKDRIAIGMLNAAEKAGRLKPGATIIEGTSGNTGFGLALVCAVRGYKTIFTITDKQSREKIDMMKALGAEVIVCPTAVAPEDPRSYYSVAKKLSKEIPNSFYPNQYANPENPKAHYNATAPEIWKDSGGKITHFVCGMGTGGTVSGIGKFLKEKNPKIKIIGADPPGSLYYQYFKKGTMGKAETYKVEGIGEDIIPKTMNFAYVDDVIRVTDKDSFLAVRDLARKEGLFAGGSSGSAIWAALKIAKKLSSKDWVVCLLPDTGMRYLSKVYNDDWMIENRYLSSTLSMTAGDILAQKRFEKFIWAKPSDTVAKVWSIMETKEVSHLPVRDASAIVGSISEDTITKLVVGGQDVKKLLVREIMAEPLHEIPGDTPVDELFKVMTSKIPALVVRSKRGELGIITKYDVVHSLYKFLGKNE